MSTVTKRKPRYGWYGQSLGTFQVGATVRYTQKQSVPLPYGTLGKITSGPLDSSYDPRQSRGKPFWQVTWDNNIYTVMAEWAMEVV